ncbi:MAG: hypothetical protein R2939_21900 [Kofleriaceae bacterium]
MGSRPRWIGAAVMATAIVGAGLMASFGGACGDPPPGRTYYERVIEPILVQRCAGNTSGCHATNDDDPYQFAAGNLDVTSFERVQKRRDLLAPFGAYQYPLLLVKAVWQGELPLRYEGESRELEVLHTGGALLEVNSDAFLTLLTWLDNGATENGLPPPTPAQVGGGPCSTSIPAGFDPAPYVANPNFASFVATVQPVIEGCAAGNCHGAPQSDFYVTCGDDEPQRAFNFSQAWSFVSTPVDDSQILRVPLAVSAGGGPHSGGDQFASTTAANYTAIRTWAEAVGRLEFGVGEPAKEFFADHVQPALLVRGCAFQACHSPSATNDFKFRSGTRGFYSAVATQRNYDLLREEFMALEYPDARRGRAVAKTTSPTTGGIAHRGGSILETPGAGFADPATCPQPIDPATATPFCLVQHWLDLERAELLADDMVTSMDEGDTVPIVYVERAETHVATPLAFDTYQPGSDLLVATATFGPGQRLASVALPATSLLASCGVAPGQADVRDPDVRLDGDTVAFAMRTSAADPLGLWTVSITGGNCTRVTPAVADVGGIKIHNFDPAWSPDGEYLVFASTRGTSGPTRSRQLFLPQSDLWRMRLDGSGLEQMTFLTNSELAPNFMREGRVIMTTEKVSGGFYQLAGRRLNWDLTDYHPLLAQRAESLYVAPGDLTSTLPSVDYGQATDIRESSNGNFLLILSDPGARGGAGTLAVFNRSVGTFEAGRVDEDPGFLEAMHLVDPAATGRVGSATSGAYRGAFPLPDGTVLTSYAAFSGDLGSATQFAWDLVSIDPSTGARQVLVGGAGAQVDAVLAIKRPPGRLFLNRRQLVFGGAVDPGLSADRAVIHFPDAPAVFTLLTGNLRRGRPVEEFRRATQLAVYLEEPAPSGTTSGSGPGGIFESRQLLGRAPLAADGSVRVNVPAGAGVILALEDGSGNTVVTMTEEHQVGPGEAISLGIKADLFDAVCGGCHGSISGSELDIAVTPDALTGASESLSATATPVMIAP